MPIKLPLHEMTIQEKLAAMEFLWEDLSRSPEAIESPEWHKDILDERRHRVANGTAQFEDWEAGQGQDSREASVRIESLDEAADSLFSNVDSLLLLRRNPEHCPGVA